MMALRGLWQMHLIGQLHVRNDAGELRCSYLSNRTYRANVAPDGVVSLQRKRSRAAKLISSRYWRLKMMILNKLNFLVDLCSGRMNPPCSTPENRICPPDAGSPVPFRCPEMARVSQNVTVAPGFSRSPGVLEVPMVQCF